MEKKYGSQGWTKPLLNPHWDWKHLEHEAVLSWHPLICRKIFSDITVGLCQGDQSCLVLLVPGEQFCECAGLRLVAALVAISGWLTVVLIFKISPPSINNTASMRPIQLFVMCSFTPLACSWPYRNNYSVKGKLKLSFISLQNICSWIYTMALPAASSY